MMMMMMMKDSSIHKSSTLNRFVGSFFRTALLFFFVVVKTGSACFQEVEGRGGASLRLRLTRIRTTNSFLLSSSPELLPWRANKNAAAASSSRSNHCHVRVPTFAAASCCDDDDDDEVAPIVVVVKESSSSSSSKNHSKKKETKSELSKSVIVEKTLSSRAPYLLLLLLVAAVTSSAASASAYDEFSCSGGSRISSCGYIREVPILLAATAAAVLNQHGPVTNVMTPLALSLFAGLWTCVGASIAFFLYSPKDTSNPEAATITASEGEQGSVNKDPNYSSFIIKEQQQPSSASLDNVLCFSLALAGSVMVTVSLVSLLPEIFAVAPPLPPPPSTTSLSVSTTAADPFQLWRSTSSSSSNWWFFFWGSRVSSLLGGCLVSLGLSRALGVAGAASTTDEAADIVASSSFVVNSSMVAVVAATEEDSDDTAGTTTTVSCIPAPQESHNDDNMMMQRRIQLSSSEERFCQEEEEEEGLLAVQIFARDDADESSDAASSSRRARAWRLTLLLFISLALHNFPEGFAVAASSLHSTKLGISTAVAIACHNLPEGVAVAVPCLVARPKEPWLAFGLASLSGLAEPLGAALALAMFRGTGYFSTASYEQGEATALACVLAFVAGVMVTVALTELLPEAVRHASSTRVVEREEENQGRRHGRLPPPWLMSPPLIGGTVTGVLLMIVTESILA